MMLLKKIIDPDTELFLEVKKGDDQAFKKLYQKYYPKVLNLIFRFIPIRQDAEDIAQEVFLRVYFGAKTFSPQAKFTTWLYKVTVNRCFSHHQKTKRAQERYMTDADLPTGEKHTTPLTLENHPSPGSSPHDHITQQELHQVMQSALDKLPPDQKIAFILLEHEGLSYQEIGHITNASVKAVERRIYHARQKLKKFLKPYVSA